ncbi:CBS domain-containing protein [Streptomyces sp. JL2001]|uniref:CBS domain-containing protein n=1 Tax=Streptomyces sp. JL2001 TaxID=3342488 RepID=UPI003D806507
MTFPPTHTTTVEPAPQVRDDMTVEVAISVLTSARSEHLVVCDEDDQCSGRVTMAHLATIRDSTAYTDRVRLRDVLGRPVSV